MSEQQVHIVKLSPLRTAFYDPVSRINLSRTNPQGFIPVGSPISGSVKTMLLSGGLIDVTGDLLPAIIAERAEKKKQKKAGFPRPPVGPESTDERPVQQEEKVEEPEAPVDTPPELEVPQATPVEEKPAKPNSRSKTK